MTNSTQTTYDPGCTKCRYARPGTPGDHRDHVANVRHTITVRMAGLGETWTLSNVPAELAPMVHDLDASGILCYGPDYSRQAAEAVRDASRFFGWGDVEAAERYLRKAWERIG